MSAHPARQTIRLLSAIEHLPTGGTLILTDVSWEDYDRLLAELGDSNRVRVSYDEGRLEIMSPTQRHEMYKEMILRLTDVIADELDCDLDSFGSTTFRQEQMDKGAEPDTCFYIQNAGCLTGKKQIVLGEDPPPDVAVEVDVSHESTTKFGIYAKLGVPEIWRYDEQQLQIHHLTETGYAKAPASRAFPFLTGGVLTEFLDRSKTEKQRAVLKSFRKWVRTHRPKTP